jgi:hypothetical protein
MLNRQRKPLTGATLFVSLSIGAVLVGSNSGQAFNDNNGLATHFAHGG